MATFLPGALFVGGMMLACLADPQAAAAGGSIPQAAEGESVQEQSASAEILAGSAKQLCLPPDDTLRTALADHQSQLVLILDRYTPAAGGNGEIVVSEVRPDGTAGERVATIGLFPNTAFGPGDEPRKFFLPETALARASADKPLCFMVEIPQGGSASSGGMASVTLTLEKLG